MNGRSARRSVRRGRAWIHRGNLRSLLIVVGCLIGRPDAGLLLAGGAIAALGAGLHIAAKGTLRQNRVLAARGPYRWCRHPFYLANFLIDVGLMVMVGQPWLMIPYFILWRRVYGASMEREEALLEGLFGAAYRRYSARVPRIVPHRRPLPADPEAPGFSWRNPNLAGGSAYARLTRLAAVPPLLWLAARLRELLLSEGSPELRVGDPLLVELSVAAALLVAARGVSHALRFRREAGAA